MGAPDTASSYKLDRKLTPGEFDIGIALVRLGLQPLCIVNLFSKRSEKLNETRKAVRRPSDRRRRAEQCKRARERVKVGGLE